MRRLLPSALAACVSISQPCLAQDSPEEERTAFNIASPRGRFSNSTRVYGQRFHDLPTFEDRADAEMTLSANYGRYSAKATPWAWILIPESRGARERRTRAYAELKEAWVEAAYPAVDFQAGNQIVAWGSTDVFNPTDDWNPVDATDPFAAKKLPQPLLRAAIHPPDASDHKLEILASPFFRESRLPISYPESGVSTLSLTDTRWLLGLPSTLYTGGIYFPLRYEVASPNYPATWQAGARYQLLRVGSWDLAASAYLGVEKVPRFYLARKGDARDPSLPITVTLNPSFHREQIYGVGGQGSFTDSDIVLRFELAYRHADNSRATAAGGEAGKALTKDDHATLVLGADYTFPDKVLWTVMYVNASLILDQPVTRNEGTSDQIQLTGLPETNPWNRNLVLFTENRIGDFWKVRNSVVTSFKNWDAYYYPSVAVQINDELSAALGVDLFIGSTNGFFGQFGDNRRSTLTLSYEL